MTSSAPPARPDPDSVLDEIYQRVAVRRRARRLRRGMMGGAAVLAVAAGLVAVSLRPTSQTTTVEVGGAPAGVPASFVDTDGNGGIGVFSTATGALERTLSPQTSGGPDQQPMLSPDGSSVYFVQPAGACSSTIDRVRTTGPAAPATVIASARTVATEPAPDPSGTRLAWVGVACGRAATATLWVSDLATGARTDLGAFTGGTSDDGIAWNPSGTRLAVETGPGLAVIDPATPDALAHSTALEAPPGCTLADPAFLDDTGWLAAVETCQGPTSGTSRVVALDLSTGRRVATLAVAPPATTFVSLSADATGQLLLEFLDGSVGILVRVDHGRLVTLSHSAPSSQQW